MLSEALKTVEVAMVSVTDAKTALTEAQAAAKLANAAVESANAAWMKAAEGARASQAELQKVLSELMPPTRHEIR